MKKLIARPKRVTFIAVSIIIAIVCIVLFVVDIVYPTTEIKEVKQYYHKWEENIDWRSSVEPNDIFDKTFLNKDDFLFKKFTKSVLVYFDIPFTFSEEVEFEGSYQIVGYLEALYGKDKELLWNRKIPISESKSLLNNGDSLNISAKGFVNLKKYKELIEREMKESDLVAIHQFRVAIEIQGEVVSKQKIIPIDIKPSVVYPLSQDAAKGVEELSAETLYEVMQEVEEVVPNNKLKRIIVSILGLLSIAATVFLLVATVNVKISEFTKFVNQILRQHGDRMVKVPKMLKVDNSNLIELYDVLDVVKIADEISQPIFYYCKNDNMECQIILYVFDESRLFCFSRLG